MLGKKSDSLLDITSRGLNTHNYVITRDKGLALITLLKYGLATIRCDNNIGIHLPMLIYKGELEVAINMLSLLEEYDVIIADGLKYDLYLECNLVAYIDIKGNFIAEFNSAKVPLRYMYNYPLNSLRGSVFDRYTQCEKINYPDETVPVKLVLDFLFEMFLAGISNVNMEATIYTIPVGIKSKNYVIWELKKL